MQRPIWKGQVTFGLVSVPVTLHSAEKTNDVSFHLLDARDSGHIRYQRINEDTGEEVPWDKIVKGYEFSDGNYVRLTETDLERAQPELTHAIEIEAFVDLNKIDVSYFHRPYYVSPAKGGEKGYVLLREAMKATGRVGISRIVIRARGHLAALMPQGDALILELLRYHKELKPIKEFDIPAGNKGKHHVTAKELELAKGLVEGMAAEWSPADFEDEYRESLMKLIHKRIKARQYDVSPEAEEPEADEPPPTVNFIDVLRRSVEGRASKKKPARKKPAAKRPRKRRAS